jgi:hypothetical protein
MIRKKSHLFELVSIFEKCNRLSYFLKKSEIIQEVNLQIAFLTIISYDHSNTNLYFYIQILNDKL